MTALALAGNALPAFAATYLVDTTADVPTLNKTTLRQAVSQANVSSDNFVEFSAALNGSTITLSQGEIAINQPMTIVGPGAANLTISGNDASRIFDISTASTTPLAVTLSGLTLSHGHAGNSLLGGAIYTSNVSLTLLDATLAYNNALQGAAIYLHSGSGVASAAKFMRTTVANNSTTTFGQAGGILARGGATVQIVDSIISANTASSSGGAFFYDVGSTTIETSQITGNHATFSSDGGLLFFHSPISAGTSTVTIDNSTISGNSSALNGGGLQLTNVVATLTGDTISGNSASAAGGGVFVFDSTATTVTQLTLQQSSVTGNNAMTFGGGIDVNAALSVTVSRALISGNNVYNTVGGGGGGISLEDVKTQSNIGDSTIYGNYAYNNGGGVGIFNVATGNATSFDGDTIAGNFTFNYDSNGILGAGVPQIYNCAIANNFSHTISQDVSGTFAELYSLVRNVGSASLSVNIHNKNGQDPLLGPLAVNGGPTLTMLPALSSPLLDSGGPNPAGSDQRGLPRNVNGRRDMGAVERQYPEDVIFRSGFDSS